MKGSEKQIIEIVGELKETDREAIGRRVGVSSKYVAEICQGLVNDGYLIERGNGRYQLTQSGLNAISPVKTRGPIAVLKGGG